MESKKLFHEYLRYITLNICGMIGLSCYILADTYFIAKSLGANGLAALNLAIPVYSFIHGSGLMLGMGAATKYTIFQGQKKQEYADKTFSNALCLTAIFAAVFVFMGIFFAGTLTTILGADREIFSMTKTYLQILLIFAPAFLMNNVLLCFVRNDGNPRLSMAAMLIGSLANIVLDYILIFPLRMGILGAVLATALAPTLSMCILSKHWITKQNHFHIRRLQLSADLTKATLSLGLPSLITEFASGIVMIAFNFIILGLLGNIGVAAYGIVANLSLVVISIYTGIAQGTQPITSRAYGLGNRDEITKILRYATVTIALMSLFIYVLSVINNGFIVGIFNNAQDAYLQRIAESGLILYFTAIPFVGFNIVLSTHFTSIEKALPAQALSLTRGLFLIVPIAFTLAYFFGMTGVWLSYPLTECIVSILGVILYQKFAKSSMRQPS
ncbi:MAG: MATE family efflux transporter [Lachnospiraceae bacterium]|nr:MATE family efflux transporter [Lachnospiraceae bacterium]